MLILNLMPWWFYPTVATVMFVVGTLTMPLTPGTMYHPRPRRWVWVMVALVCSNIAWIIAGAMK